jgi:hypothetical protein
LDWIFGIAAWTDSGDCTLPHDHSGEDLQVLLSIALIVFLGGSPGIWEKQHPFVDFNNGIY